MTAYEQARGAYGDLGIDVEKAIRRAAEISISIHCWQADDVSGFEVKEGATDGGGIMATGNYLGRAGNVEEVRSDLEKVLTLVPGSHRVNLHASYADTEGKKVARDEVAPEHFKSWTEWAKTQGIGLDFNPTYFAHPMADSGYTLAHRDPEVRAFWVRHGIASRHIAQSFAAALGGECINNHWIPDGAKDHPADRWSPRARLVESLDQILAAPIEGCTDAVESKLFGLGSEDYVVGSFEFYSHYALRHDKVFCLDMGHFHPTESVADKLSSLLQFHRRLLLHTSRPMRWDSDHVVLYNDELRAVFQEIARGDAWERVLVALDFFDASINRIAAYVIGIRATRKAILYALLDPSAQLRDLEIRGNLAGKLARMEHLKTLPFGAVWDELCRRAEVPEEGNWFAEADRYEEQVLSKR